MSAAIVHPTASIAPGVVLGQGTRIAQHCHMAEGSRIGDNCTLGSGVAVGPGVVIGNGCRIKDNVSLCAGVELEDRVFCGPSVTFSPSTTPRAFMPRAPRPTSTHIGHGVTLSAGVTVACGVTVGRCAFVTAGSVVTRDVPDHALVSGNPAHQLGWVCRCGLRLDPRLVCPECGIQYESHAQGLRPQALHP